MVEFSETPLPKTATGRIVERELRDRFSMSGERRRQG